LFHTLILGSFPNCTLVHVVCDHSGRSEAFYNGVVCCQQVCALQKQDAGEDELRESLVAHRRLLDRLDTGPAIGLQRSIASNATTRQHLIFWGAWPTVKMSC
jgi:hypothetical protein